LETALYGPVKRFLESRGFAVKGEIGGCDLVGVKGEEAPVVVIGELKLAFNLELVLQAVDRASVGDEIWLAARMSKRGKGREHDARFRNLCRRLGFGLLGVTGAGAVEVLLSPVSPMPRRDPKRRARLLDEHRRRKGDPVAGGGSGRPVMTAYRQQALACAAALTAGPLRPRDLKPAIPEAAAILHRNVYDWFVRERRGVYTLSDIGRAALLRWPQAVSVEDGSTGEAGGGSETAQQPRREGREPEGDPGHGGAGEQPVEHVRAAHLAADA
jgi:hypothetical protein